jgi:hypothetical protein
MSPTALIIGGALLLAIICVSLYGAASLPPGAQMPVHFGPAGYNRWVSKSIGLVLYPVGGAVIFAIITVAVRGHQTHGGLGPPAGVCIALGVLLVSQIGALAIARNRNGNGNGDRG